MKFETLQKSKALNSTMTKIFVILDACQYWHLSSFRPQFWTKNGNFPILIKFCTLHKPRVVNSMVTMVFCDSWQLSILTIVNIGNCYLLGHSFQPNTANAPVLMKFCTLHKECGEFNGFDIDRCKWVRQRIKTWNQKTNLVSKIVLLHYKQNW